MKSCDTLKWMYYKRFVVNIIDKKSFSMRFNAKNGLYSSRIRRLYKSLNEPVVLPMMWGITLKGIVRSWQHLMWMPLKVLLHAFRRNWSAKLQRYAQWAHYQRTKYCENICKYIYTKLKRSTSFRLLQKKTTRFYKLFAAVVRGCQY